MLAEKTVMPPSSLSKIKLVGTLERKILERPQLKIKTSHVIHSGVYSRTIMMPAGSVLTSAVIKIPTTVTVSGDVTVSTNDDPVRITGYRVIAASAARKLAYLAHADTYITMAFATSARSVEAAEREFTDDHEQLFSRNESNPSIVITE